MFLSITEDFQPLPPLKGKIQVPTDLLATVEEVQLALKQIKVCKSVGPDNIPNTVLKEFAPELAIVIQDIYNQSLIESYVPQLLRCSIISPVPKETPPPPTINGNRSAPDFTHVYIGQSDGRPILQALPTTIRGEGR